MLGKKNIACAIWKYFHIYIHMHTKLYGTTIWIERLNPYLRPLSKENNNKKKKGYAIISYKISLAN